MNEWNKQFEFNNIDDDDDDYYEIHTSRMNELTETTVTKTNNYFKRLT